MHRRLIGGKEGKRFFAILCLYDLVSVIRKYTGEYVPYYGLVFGQQDGLRSSLVFASLVLAIARRGFHSADREIDLYSRAYADLAVYEDMAFSLLDYAENRGQAQPGP